MLNVVTRYAIHAEHAKGMDTDALRENFLAESLFVEGEINLVYTHYDRMVLGGAVPGSGVLTLDHVDQAGTPSFLDRREMGVVNIGDAGTVSAGGETWSLNRGDVLYLGSGSGPVTFEGAGRYYLASTPAHRNFPSRLITIDEAEKMSLGSSETSNQRTINQFIHPLVMESCQLVMGYTALEVGSVWNTMPAHTHDGAWRPISTSTWTRTLASSISWVSRRRPATWFSPMSKRRSRRHGPFIRRRARRIIPLFGPWVATTWTTRTWISSSPAKCGKWLESLRKPTAREGKHEHKPI